MKFVIDDQNSTLTLFVAILHALLCLLILPKGKTG